MVVLPRIDQEEHVGSFFPFALLIHSSSVHLKDSDDNIDIIWDRVNISFHLLRHNRQVSGSLKLLGRDGELSMNILFGTLDIDMVGWGTFEPILCLWKVVIYEKLGENPACIRESECGMIPVAAGEEHGKIGFGTEFTSPMISRIVVLTECVRKGPMHLFMESVDLYGK